MDNIGTSTKRIADSRLIAGYFRDALLNGYSFILEVATLTVTADINSISEPSAREKEGARKVEFKLSGSSSSHDTELEKEISQTVRGRVAFERMLIHFEATLERIDNQTLWIGLPKEITVIVQRERHRFSADAIQPNIALLKLETQFKTTHGIFQLSDVSEQGFGGYLVSPEEVDNTKSIMASGSIYQSNGAIKIRGQVAWLEKDSTVGGHCYRIGIASRAGDSSVPQFEDPGERRRNKRVRATFPLEVVSPLFPEATAVLHLENMSMKGLKTRILNQSDRILFRENLEVMLKSPRLRLRVHSIENDFLTFAILPSSVEEHIRLSNLIASFSETDVINTTAVGNDFLQVFAVSGSISANLAKIQALFKDQLRKSIQKSNIAAPWFIRWNQQSKDGRIRATSLAALYGNQVWYIGGVAGHLDPDLKMSKDFIPRHYRHLADLFEGLSRHEYVFFNWFTSNIWWKEWEEELSSRPETDSFFRFKGDIAYFSDFPPKNNQRIDNVKLITLSESTPTQIEDTLERLPKKIRSLFRALGLAPFSFGCRALSELLDKNQHAFAREFYRCEIGRSTCVIMVSRFPIDATPNGIINYPLIYCTQQLENEEIDKLSALVLNLASDMGVCPPAFFISCEASSCSNRTSVMVGLKEVVWTFGHSELLNFWRQK